jgi:hypothetical protein
MRLVCGKLEFATMQMDNNLTRIDFMGFETLLMFNPMGRETL